MNTLQNHKIAILGDFAPFHIGAHFFNAAENLQLHTYTLSTKQAFAGSKLLQKWNWWLNGRRPTQLDNFSKEVYELCHKNQIHYLLTTGIAPINASSLKKIGDLGVKRYNFLTDDPFNKQHYAPWFLHSLPHYDHVFSPRQGNMSDLKEIGVKTSYLPFAYAPEIHFPESANVEEKEKYSCDVLFIGGADKDRVQYMKPLIEAGFAVALWGGYWDRYAITKPYHRGYADPTTTRKAVSEAKICLGIGRHANRDGHAMRSFEVPAMKGCFLVEKTAEHQNIFGEDKQNVLYFVSIEEMIKNAQWLLDHPQERERLAEHCYQHITQHPHRYKDRLQSMLNIEL